MVFQEPKNNGPVILRNTMILILAWNTPGLLINTTFID